MLMCYPLIPPCTSLLRCAFVLCVTPYPTGNVWEAERLSAWFLAFLKLCLFHLFSCVCVYHGWAGHEVKCFFIVFLEKWHASRHPESAQVVLIQNYLDFVYAVTVSEFLPWPPSGLVAMAQPRSEAYGRVECLGIQSEEAIRSEICCSGMPTDTQITRSLCWEEGSHTILIACNLRNMPDEHHWLIQT